MQMATLSYLRSFRVAGYAVFDFAVSFTAAEFVARQYQLPRALVYSAVLPLGLVAHLATGQQTPMTQRVLSGWTPERFLILASLVAFVSNSKIVAIG